MHSLSYRDNSDHDNTDRGVIVSYKLNDKNRIKNIHVILKHDECEKEFKFNKLILAPFNHAISSSYKHDKSNEFISGYCSYIVLLYLLKQSHIKALISCKFFIPCCLEDGDCYHQEMLQYILLLLKSLIKIVKIKWLKKIISVVMTFIKCHIKLFPIGPSLNSNLYIKLHSDTLDSLLSESSESSVSSDENNLIYYHDETLTNSDTFTGNGNQLIHYHDTSTDMTSTDVTSTDVTSTDVTTNHADNNLIYYHDETLTNSDTFTGSGNQLIRDHVHHYFKKHDDIVFADTISSYTVSDDTVTVFADTISDDTISAKTVTISDTIKTVSNATASIYHDCGTDDATSFNTSFSILEWSSRINSSINNELRWG
ncbi:MAG TPA: hypothetical protein VLG50_05950 [Candidatus Saccharimonadales bacterium]|nr:hypothetical protein [Candidatus Saccharimonadales bacterium]